MFPVNNNGGGAIINAMLTRIDNGRAVHMIWIGDIRIAISTRIFRLGMNTVKFSANILSVAGRQYFAIQIEEGIRERINFIQAVKHGLKQSYIYQVLQSHHAE